MSDSDSDIRPQPTCWPCVNYRDARAAIAFLVDAFGFVETVAVPGDGPDVVVHAELVWPEGGGVMLGTADRGDGSPFSQMPTSAASVYVVTDRPDELYARARAAGAELVRDMADEDYGSRGFSVRDPEGNIWSFGTYRGEPLPT
jgi:uncharacterized glyoxalase superfamily protein PhnB